MHLKPDKPASQETKRIYLYANMALIVAFGLIFVRLWYLQILKGDYFKNLSENNRIRIQEIDAPRGLLYDRNGISLVDGYPSFDVSLYRQDVPNLDALILPLSRILCLSPAKIRARIEGAKATVPPHQPLKIKTDIPRAELAAVETRRPDLPGIVVDVVIRRHYPFKDLASHLIGYLGEINSRELEREEYASHKIGSLVGKSGIEKRYELELMGDSGGRQIEVNALGQRIRLLGQVEPSPGNNLVLTLDLELQKAAEEAMRGKRGALVAMNPQNGDILALVSKPDFDPNLFARGLSVESWRSIVENPAHPLQNRAVQGQYPPGSVFKVIVAIAALEEHVVTPETTFQCTGIFSYGDRDYRCWKENGHGRISFRQAMVESCDIYFYHLGLLLGVDRIAQYAYRLGLGSPTGYPLGQEKPGLVPTSSWKWRRLGIPWQPGETISTAIGQGFILVTPLQVASTLSAIANGGKVYRPRIVESIRSSDGEFLREVAPSVSRSFQLSPSTLKLLRESLWAAVNSPAGTGGQALVPGLDVAGKTGTAQVIQRREDQSEPVLPGQQDHAWFACFAPVNDPQITVVVLIEHGGHGGAAAAPIARKVLEVFQRNQKKAPPPPSPLVYRHLSDQRG
jgi:penicillin-binding protein 2